MSKLSIAAFVCCAFVSFQVWAGDVASVSVSLTAPEGSAADYGKNSLKSMLFSPCNNAGSALGAQNKKGSVKDQISVKLSGVNTTQANGQVDKDLYFFFVNLGAKGNNFPTSIGDAQFYVLRRYRAFDGTGNTTLTQAEVKLRTNASDLRRTDVLLQKADFKTAAFSETILGDTISLEDLDLPMGTWLAVAILADQNDLNFSFNDASTWAAWDAVPLVIGSPWPTKPAKTCHKGITQAKPFDFVQQMHQGVIVNTHSTLDLAISGNGLFVLANPVMASQIPTPSAYSRYGHFQIDYDGNLVNDLGQYVMGYEAKGKTMAEGFNTHALKLLKIDPRPGLPSVTKNISVSLNLKTSESIPYVTPFDPANPKSYNNTTAISIFDSQGNSHVASLYFLKDETFNSWTAYLFIDGYGISPSPFGNAAISDQGFPGSPITLTFNASGLLDTVDGNQQGLSTLNIGSIAHSQLSIDFRASTQFDTPFEVNNLQQDGFPVGNFTGADVNYEGVIVAHYSNGDSRPLGQVALANFISGHALMDLSDNGLNTGHGAPFYGAAGSNFFGDIQSSALEDY